MRVVLMFILKVVSSILLYIAAMMLVLVSAIMWDGHYIDSDVPMRYLWKKKKEEL
jgi:hypothetical protein